MRYTGDREEYFSRRFTFFWVLPLLPLSSLFSFLILYVMCFKPKVSMEDDLGLKYKCL